MVSRNTRIHLQGQAVDVPQVARQLKVSHVLEGSVRKAGGRVRITAQLIDAAKNDQIWAERYDRDLNDIFALQDEISEAIVKALKLKLLPEEKKAIEQRGTENVEAYNLYLMARQNYATGIEQDPRRAEASIRMCHRATEIDPGYARAWALMALGQMLMHFAHGRRVDDGLAAAERALELDNNLAEAHAVKARILAAVRSPRRSVCRDRHRAALDPESYEVNKSAAYLRIRQHRLADAIPFYEKAMTLMETDVNSPSMLKTCYAAVGDTQSVTARVETLRLPAPRRSWSGTRAMVPRWATVSPRSRALARPPAPRSGSIGAADRSRQHEHALQLRMCFDSAERD